MDGNFQVFKPMGLSLVLAAAGKGTRFLESLKHPIKIKKQWLLVRSTPLWQRVCEQFMRLGCFERVVVVAGDRIEQVFMQARLPDACVVVGGESRQESVQNALKQVQSPLVVVSDVARFGLDLGVLHNLLDRMRDPSLQAIAPALPPTDTLIYQDRPLDRDHALCVQTPQVCRTNALKKAYSLGRFSDESSALLASGARVDFIPGSAHLHKLTTAGDLAMLAPLLDPPAQHVGMGFDVHAFESNKPLKLGGVLINPSDCQNLGLKAHSDGDVLLHALSDALLGAIKGGDIGMYFSDQDSAFANLDSSVILEAIHALAQNMGHEISGVDLSLLAQIPKIAPYRQRICENIARLLRIPPYLVNLKASTTEHLGFIGRKEGMGAQAVVQTKTYPPKYNEKS
ncbi:2-C-methyl-D-erythritol 2,4-cyclodiphosphate synthase [Helicobacter labacensis]|uniref:2-C-methyl-D-erythritol 2,4-cyclodiphosphate synthase n=1 Tax=Helicobacter labacensis TaxID=2316079 RepID=UPI001F42A99F|nr:2-C-methyl-D-erythritol 2,4-cyclodiphosphate synthase [Helicobacter labacensis]